MATEEPQSPDGFAPAVQDYDNGESTLELDAGEEFIGLVLQIEEDEGEYGTYWRLRLKPDDGDPVTYFAKDQVKTAIKQGNLEEGSRVWIARGVTEQEIDGNSYLPTKCEVAN